MSDRRNALTENPLASSVFLAVVVLVIAVGATGITALLVGAAGPRTAVAESGPAVTETRVAATADAVTTPNHERVLPQEALTPVEFTAVVDLPVVQAELGYAPNAAPAVDRDHQALVEVDLITTEHVAEIADGVEYNFWTFNGSVPGPMIRVRQGDAIRLTLQNDHGSAMPHNIDLHAVTGQGGGAEATLTMPGRETGVLFRALNPGVYIYHCATAPVAMHIANGMYGLIVVEPEEGYEPVDQEYYVVQGDVYTEGEFGEKGMQAFSMERGIAEDPSYVLFNGRVGAIAGDNALTAEVGDTVRLWVGNGGPNLVSSFHVIGEIFDRVHHEGGAMVNRDVQTTLVPAGGATMVEFDVEVPGTLNLVDHSIFRTFHKGTLGQIEVTGEENHEVFSERLFERSFEPSDAATAEAN